MVCGLGRTTMVVCGNYVRAPIIDPRKKKKKRKFSNIKLFV